MDEAEGFPKPREELAHGCKKQRGQNVKASENTLASSVWTREEQSIRQ